MRFTNIQPGPRGINAVSGTIVVAPKETVEAEVYEREREHLEASNWFDIKGDYTPNPCGAHPQRPRPSPRPAARACRFRRGQDDRPTRCW